MDPIHYRRRWFYVLWGALLLVSLGALALWETPGQIGTAKLALQLTVKDLPAGVDVKVWAGPRRRWPGAAWTGQGAAAQVRPVGAGVVLKAFPLSVAYRRWVKDIIPRRTADLVVLRFEAPGQTPRYMVLPLRQDWQIGLLRPGREMSVGIQCPWDGLWTDPTGFSAME